MTDLIVPDYLGPVSPLHAVDLGFATIGTVQPFSARTGIGYQDLLETLRVYIQNDLYNFLTAANPQDVWDGNVDRLLEAVAGQLTDSLGNVNSALGLQSTNIQNALSTQQTAVNQQLAATLAGLQGGSLNVTDPVITNAINTANSQTRAALIALFAAKGDVTALQDLVATGRLSQGTLDTAYGVTDAKVAAFASDANSQLRAAFNAVYQSVQMRVNAGYIQWKLTGSPTWINLVAETDLAGGTGPTGAPGAPGGAAELAYSEVASGTVTIATGTGDQDVTGMTMSFVMPSRPVMLDMQAVIRFNSATSTNDAALRMYETTGGGSTVIAEGHSGLASTNGDYSHVFTRRRITGTAGVTRTFKLSGRKDSAVAWTLNPSSAYPIWMGAYQV